MYISGFYIINFVNINLFRRTKLYLIFYTLLLIFRSWIYISEESEYSYFMCYIYIIRDYFMNLIVVNMLSHYFDINYNDPSKAIWLKALMEFQ